MSASQNFLEFLALFHSQPFFLIVAWCFSFFVCRYLSSRPYILADLPNQRSGHQRTVSRGGALAISLPILLFLFSSLFIFSSSFFEAKNAQVALAFSLGALFFALLGFLDDCCQLSALRRFCLSFLFCSVLCPWALQDSLRIGGFHFSAWPVVLLQVLWLLTCINFFNFMDGMDALAGLQAWWIASITCLAVGLDIEHLLAFSKTASLDRELGLHSFVFWAYLSLACVLTAFLYWNWPRAKLFMGDGGSYFLGFALGFAPLWAIELGPTNQSIKAGYFPRFDAGLMALAWMPFLMDASLTLLGRLRSKANIFRAHRQHIYQKLLAKQWSSEKVLMLYFFLNCGFLAPIILWLISPEMWQASLFLALCITTAVFVLFIKLRRN